jgi:hypothetical protein
MNEVGTESVFGQVKWCYTTVCYCTRLQRLWFISRTHSCSYGRHESAMGVSNSVREALNVRFEAIPNQMPTYLA